MRELGAARHVRGGVAVLVDVDRDRRALAQHRSAGVACPERLLAVLDAERGQLWQRLQCLVDAPPLVDVHHQRPVGHAAHRANAVDVEPVAAAELELEAPEARRCPLGAPGHVVGVAEPDRPGGRRAGPRQAEQPPHRTVRELPAEVVERRVERTLGCALSRGLLEARADLLERERVVAERTGVRLDERERRGGGLLVAVDRCPLATPDQVAVPHLDLQDVFEVARLPRDDERLGQPQPDDLGPDLHPCDPTERRLTAVVPRQ